MVDKTTRQYQKLILTVNALQLRGWSLDRIANEIERAAAFEPDEHQAFLADFVAELRSRGDGKM